MILSYITWNIRPQIFTIGTFEVRYYSLLFGLGFIIGYYLFLRMYKKEGVSVELLDKLTIYVILATILGARLGHCLFYEPGEYLTHPLKIFLPFQGTIGKDFRFTGYQGLASHGGALGLLIGIYLYARKYKLTYLWVMDRLAIVTAQAGAFIRIGNFFNSEITGIPTTLPWGVKFMRVKDDYDIAAHEILPKHPAQLYEAIAYLLVFALLFYLYNKKYQVAKKGYFLGIFLVLVFTARFFIEFVKDVQEGFEKGMLLNMGQLLSIPFIALGLYLLFRKDPVPATPYKKGGKTKK
jgi:phosphatidylglycerol---prolipoprotein diacylglyceryl transferase